MSDLRRLIVDVGSLGRRMREAAEAVNATGLQDELLGAAHALTAVEHRLAAVTLDDYRPRPALEVEGRLSIDPIAGVVVVDGREVAMGARTLEVLAVMAGAPTRVWTRPQLYRAVWGVDLSRSSRALDSQVKRLRDALGDGWVMTVRGRGYRLLPAASAAVKDERRATCAAA